IVRGYHPVKQGRTTLKAASIVDFSNWGHLVLKILVIRACAVGDFVVNLPALQALQNCDRHARFTLVGYPSTLEIAREFVSVEAIHSIDTDPWRRIFHEPMAGLNFDRAIVWMKDPSVAENLRQS